MSSQILTGDWWKAALARAGRTAAVVAVPYVPITLGGQEYLLLLSAAGMGAILSLLTSLAGLAEVQGTEQPWYFSLLSRVTKTVAQALITAFGTAALFTDVSWETVPALVVSAAVGSALLFFTKGAPEAIAPTEVIASPVEVVAVTEVTNVTNETEAPRAEATEAVAYDPAHTGDGR